MCYNTYMTVIACSSDPMLIAIEQEDNDDWLNSFLQGVEGDTFKQIREVLVLISSDYLFRTVFKSACLHF